MDKASLEKKSLSDLRYIAKMMNIKSLTTYKKPELIEMIINSETVPQNEPAQKEMVVVQDDVKTSKKRTSQKEPKKSTKSNSAKVVEEDNKSADISETSMKTEKTQKNSKDKKIYNKNVSKGKKNIDKSGFKKETVVEDSAEKSVNVQTDKSAVAPKRRGRPSKKNIKNEVLSDADVAVNVQAENVKVEINAESRDFVSAVTDDESSIANGEKGETNVASVDIVSGNEVSNDSAESDDVGEAQSKPGFEGNGKDTEGILDVLQEGYGFLRSENFVAGNKDTYVSPQLIRKYGLKTGDYIVGKTRIQRDNDTKNQALTWITTINGCLVSEHPRRRPFETLTPIYPDEKLVLEVEQNEFSTRLIDLIAPIGKGQRGMIVSPPKAGKTVLLKKIANSITANYPDVELIVLLIDERPEEVTDMRESVKGTVVSSTFDELPERHIKVSELVLERAQRLVEYGKDVVILMDSITRLARAYNLTIPPTGRSLSGGLDPGALHKPKKFFGAARNIRGGGSLTIVATALVDTGSKLDDVIFEEFKGTGNMELHLDRKLSEKRIFPAIDINKSGTRKEELLLTEKELNVIFNIRRAMSNLGTADVTEMMVNQLTKSKTNEEFISSVKFTEKFV